MPAEPVPVLTRAAARAALAVPVGLLALGAGPWQAAVVFAGAAVALFTFGVIEGTAARAAPGWRRALVAGLLTWVVWSGVAAGTEAQRRYVKNRARGLDAEVAAARTVRNAEREVRRALTGALVVLPLGVVVAARLGRAGRRERAGVAAVGLCAAAVATYAALLPFDGELRRDAGALAGMILAMELGGLLLLVLLEGLDGLERRALGTSVGDEAWPTAPAAPAP